MKKNKKTIYTAGVLLCMVLVGVTFFIGGEKEEPEKPVGSVRIFGNSNNDDVIDDKDIKYIQSIIRGKKKWDVTQAPYADANRDGKIDQEDVLLIKKIIGKEKTRIHFVNYLGEVDNIAYPLEDRKIGIVFWREGEVLSILDLWGNCIAAGRYICDSRTHIYPETQRLYNFSNHGGATMETILESGIDLFMPSSPKVYQYAKNVSKVNNLEVLYLDSSGMDCISTALMYGIMFNQEDKARKYVDWCRKIENTIRKRLEGVRRKKVVSTIMYKRPTSDITVEIHGSGSYKFLTLLADVYDDSAAPGSMRVKRSREWFIETDPEFIFMMEEGTNVTLTDGECYTQKLYNQRFENSLNYYLKTSAYKKGQIIGSTYSFTSFGGYALLMYTAHMLYPELFSEQEALECLQYWYDEFTYADIDIRKQGGFFYTGCAYPPYEKRLHH